MKAGGGRNEKNNVAYDFCIKCINVQCPEG